MDQRVWKHPNGHAAYRAQSTPEYQLLPSLPLPSLTFPSPLHKKAASCDASHGLPSVVAATIGGPMSTPAAPAAPAATAFEEGDLVVARHPAGGFRPARVITPASAESPKVCIAFTGNSKRHHVEPKNVRLRNGPRPTTHRQPATVVVDLTLDSDEDKEKKTPAAQEVDALADAVQSTIKIRPRPSFSHAFGADIDSPRTPTKPDPEDNPPAPIIPAAEYNDPYAQRPIFPPAPGFINPYAEDPYEQFAPRPPPPSRRRSPPRDRHSEWGTAQYDEPHSAFKLSGSQFADYGPPRDRGDRVYSRPDDSRNGYIRDDHDRDSYDDGRDDRGYRRGHGSDMEYRRPNRDDNAPPSPAPTEDIPVPIAEVQREQQRIGIHPDLASMRIPRKNVDRPSGRRLFHRHYEDDAISNRHPRTWREMHMTTGGFSQAEKTARKEAARRRTSPKVPVRKKPIARAKPPLISEDSEEETVSSSDDEASEEEMTLADIRKAIHRKRPADIRPNDTRHRKKLQTPQQKEPTVVAAGGRRRPPPPKRNTGTLDMKKKKHRAPLPTKPLVIELETTETDKSLTSSDNTRTTRRRKPKKRAATRPLKSVEPEVPRPPPLPTRGNGRRKGTPRRDAGKQAISVAREIDKRVQDDYRAYNAGLESQSFEEDVFEDFNLSRQSPSSKRFFSCTCGTDSLVDRSGKIVRCALCARYSHVWCTGLSQGDIEQLNHGGASGRVQFVCVMCTEAVSEDKPLHGDAFPISNYPERRLIVPPLVFPIFDFLRNCSVPTARLMAQLLINPRRKKNYERPSKEVLQKMRKNVDMLRAGLLPRSTLQNSVSRLLMYD